MHDLLATLTFNYVTASGNKTLRQHWASRYRDRNHWRTRVFAQAALSCAPRLADPIKRRVVVTRFGKRLLDHDNYVAGLKPLLDALTDNRLIWDDRMEYLDLVTEQGKLDPGSKPHMVVHIYDA